MKKLFLSAAILLFVFTGCKAGDGTDLNNSMSSSKIIKSIDKGKPVILQGLIISDDLDFTQVGECSIFSTSHRIVEVNVPVTFLKCIFLGKVKTNGTIDNSSITTQFGSNVTFEGCDFRGEVDFSNTIIDGQVNFTGAIFRENATFNNITIKGRETYFTSFSSEKAFNMQEASIDGNIDFFKGKSKAKLSFQGTDFTGSARFSDMECDGKVDFSLTTFRSNVMFTYAKLNNEFRMSDVRCDGNCDLVSVSFSTNAWICNSIFHGKVNLSNTETKANLDLSGTLFAQGKPVVEGLKINTSGKLITTDTRYGNLNEYTHE